MLSQFLEKAQTRMKYREAIENAGAQGGAHKQTNHRLSASSCKLNSEEINSLWKRLQFPIDKKNIARNSETSSISQYANQI